MWRWLFSRAEGKRPPTGLAAVRMPTVSTRGTSPCSVRASRAEPDTPGALPASASASLTLRWSSRWEAERNREAARLWISGLETVNRKLGVARVMDLSATPFFLSGSGYVEGTLFPWTMSDFSLMDAIECGIVKLPRVPVAENIPGNELPMFRNLWENIRQDMPKKGRGTGEELDPLKLPTRLQTAMQVLYGHYERTFTLPGVNHLGTCGRWAFAEFCDVYEIESDFKAKVASQFDQMLENTISQSPQ